jgi:hypothetical protein
MRAAASLVVIAASLSFIGLMVTCLVITRGDASLRNLGRAVQMYGWAAAAEVIVLGVRIATIERTGIVWVLLALATIGMAVYSQYATRQRRALKGRRVQAEAERTVRDWRGDLP